jgi:hypothetical protein
LRFVGSVSFVPSRCELLAGLMLHYTIYFWIPKKWKKLWKRIFRKIKHKRQSKYFLLLCVNF